MISQQFSVDEVAVILAALEEITITDARNQQRNVQARLCRALKKAVPRHYKELVEAGKITDFSMATQVE